jgi:hypothetical protein
VTQDGTTPDAFGTEDPAVRALRYADLRRRLKMSVPDVAKFTGFSPGYVGRWSHGGPTALPVPDGVVERLHERLFVRAVGDLRYLVDLGVILPPQRAVA